MKSSYIYFYALLTRWTFFFIYYKIFCAFKYIYLSIFTILVNFVKINTIALFWLNEDFPSSSYGKWIDFDLKVGKSRELQKFVITDRLLQSWQNQCFFSMDVFIQSHRMIL